MAQDDLITDPALLSVLQSAAQARQQSLAILDLLEQYHARDPAASPSDNESTLDDQLALSKQQKLLHAHLAQLRGLNRKAVLGVRATKQETAERRQEIDSLHLQLQNLYYEQRHLRGEIAGCEDYEYVAQASCQTCMQRIANCISRHRYKHLPMIAVEDYLAAHPEHKTSSEHDVNIARIRDEHDARQGLEEQRQQLVKRKEALVRETGAKKEELARLDGEVEKWLGGQETVRKVFEAREKKMAG